MHITCNINRPFALQIKNVVSLNIKTISATLIVYEEQDPQRSFFMVEDFGRSV